MCLFLEEMFLIYKRYKLPPHLPYLMKIYLLLTEFEVRTVSYGPSFSPSTYGPNASTKRAGHKSQGKNEDP